MMEEDYGNRDSRQGIMLGMTDNLPEAISAYEDARTPVYTDEPRRGVYEP